MHCEMNHKWRKEFTRLVDRYERCRVRLSLTTELLRQNAAEAQRIREKNEQVWLQALATYAAMTANGRELRSASNES